MNPQDIYKSVTEVLNQEIFTINQTPVSLSSLFIFIIVIILFVLLARFFRTKVIAGVLNKFPIDQALQYTLGRLTQYVIVFTGFIVGMQFVGIDLSSLAVILGFLSVGIGFGLQNITSNFVSGLIILFEQPIKVGDRVTVNDTLGDVININIRSTSIRTLNNVTIIVPNSEFVQNQVTNWSHGEEKIRMDIEVGVSYSSDLDLVLRVLQKVAEDNPDVLKEPAPDVLLMEFGDSSWNMRIRAWIGDPKRYYYVLSAINCEIVRKFNEHNIEIPFPQRDLHVRSSAVPFIEGKN